MDDYQLPSLSATEFLTIGLQDGARLIDVRKPAAVRASGQKLTGATVIDPFSLSFDHQLLAEKNRLVFYCVHGHEVSQYAAALARVAGCEAYFVRGGYDALCAAGAELTNLVEA